MGPKLNLQVTLRFVTYFAKTLNDTYKEKAPSNKTSGLRKSMNMDIWVVVT